LLKIKIHDLNVTGDVANNAFVENLVQPDDCWIKT